MFISLITATCLVSIPSYIRPNKYENSYEAYERIRAMCEGIEDVLVDKEVVVKVQ